MLAVLVLAPCAYGLSVSAIKKHRAMELQLHADTGTLRFFRHHGHLLDPRHRETRDWAVGAIEVARHRIARLRPQPVAARWLIAAFTCIHGYEGAWNANTGNGYYGGLQMDLAFQSRYGPEFVRAYGTADNWPIRDQLRAAVRAYQSGRGFGPWPNTAGMCGLG